MNERFSAIDQNGTIDRIDVKVIDLVASSQIPVIGFISMQRPTAKLRSVDSRPLHVTEAGYELGGVVAPG